MVKFEKIVLYILMIVVFFVLLFSIKSLFNRGYSQEDYKQFVSAELPDKCQTPPEYTDEQWKQHMSHHPEQYKECLT